MTRPAMTDAAPAPAPVITAEIAARETGRHPNIGGHRERMAAMIDADERFAQAIAETARISRAARDVD